MRRCFAIIASLTLAAPAIGAPGDINADRFYVTAKELMGKGMGAMFDKRTKPMVADMKAAGERVRAANKAAVARGTPLFCVPEAARKKGLDAQRAVAILGRLPAERRKRLTLSDAWREALAREYPCR